VTTTGGGAFDMNERQGERGAARRCGMITIQHDSNTTKALRVADMVLEHIKPDEDAAFLDRNMRRAVSWMEPSVITTDAAYGPQSRGEGACSQHCSSNSSRKPFPS